MRVYAMTDIGRVRALNEDSCYIPAEGERFCAVADGMGGHNAGEVASAMAVDVFSQNMREATDISAETLHAAVARANDAVLLKSQQVEGMNGMGTTFSALAIEGETAFIAHVGDSRVYLIRRGAIMQVTTDHTLVEAMVQQGVITAREARVHPKRNIITRALGTEPRLEIDIVQISLRPDDVFFLCSDGLSGYVEDWDILRVAQDGEKDWQEKLRTLVGLALEAGGYDNITAMFAVYEEESSR